MALFRRRSAKQDDPATPKAEVTVVPTPAEPAADDAVEATGVGEAADNVDLGGDVGPFDISEINDQRGYVDLGSIKLPGIQGLVMSMEMEPTSGEVTAVRIHLGESQLQLQAFAAPKSSGIWSEIRAEIAEALAAQGGGAQEQEGPLGAELLVRMATRGQDGRTVTTAMRFVGVDRPRWFLRGVISGPAATDPEIAAPFIDLMRVTVVERGGEPMAPRELLPLRLPAESDGTAPMGTAEGLPRAGVSTDDLRPFERGPEITEIR